ncbi:MAG: hypothetical protein IJM37_01995 [Lachnospiraceae bacterium]|nr:hypothetical protein [Lachnospiraceae bacterium]
MKDVILEIDELKEKRRKRIIRVCLALLVLGGIILTFVSLRIENVNVVGNIYYTKEEAESIVFDSPYKDYSIYLWLTEKLSGYKQIPFIDRYVVKFNSLSSIDIVLYEKNIICCFEQMGTYMFINEKGMLLECGSRTVKSIPVITGIPYKNAVLNEKVSVPDDKVFEKIAIIKQILERNDLTAERIHFDTSYNPVLYIGDIKVILGNNKDTDGQIMELKSILPKLEKAGTIDMTYYKEGMDDLSYPFTYDK